MPGSQISKHRAVEQELRVERPELNRASHASAHPIYTELGSVKLIGTVTGRSGCPRELPANS